MARIPTAWLQATFGAAIAPNGHAVRDNFVDWFGASLAARRDGTPVVLYHGTAATFDAFRLSDRGSFGAGIYLTAEKTAAQTYGEAEDGAHVVEVYARFLAPYRYRADYAAGEAIDFDSYAVPLVRELMGAKADRLLAASMDSDGKFGPELRDALLARGHDSLIVTYDDGSTEFVALHPGQIKSTSNSGDFDSGSESLSDAAERVRAPAFPNRLRERSTA